MTGTRDGQRGTDGRGDANAAGDGRAGGTARSVAVFAAAGFRAVPAVGEDPVGLLLTWTTLLGLGFTVVGAGGLGVALRRVADPPRAAAVLLAAAAAVPLLVVGLRLLSMLPLPVGRLVVSTNAALLPLGVGWVALGAAVRSRAADPGGRNGR